MMHVAKNFMLQLGLWLAVVIDALLNVPFFLSISVTPLLQVAFFAMAALAVLFKVYTLLQGWKFLWSMLAAVTLFASLSMALHETKLADSAVATESKAAITAQQNEEQARKTWLDLQEQFKAASKQSTMTMLDGQIKEARILYEKAQEETKRISAADHKVFADEVFLASIKAFPDRVIPFMFFLVMFLALEVIIYATANSLRKSNKQEPVQENKEPVMITTSATPVDFKEEVIQNLTKEQEANEEGPDNNAKHNHSDFDDGNTGPDSNIQNDYSALKEIADSIASEPEIIISDKEYFLKAWPANSPTIKNAQAMSKEYGIPLSVCEDIEERLFAGQIAASYATKHKPLLSRSEYLNRRRPL